MIRIIITINLTSYEIVEDVIEDRDASAHCQTEDCFLCPQLKSSLLLSNVLGQGWTGWWDRFTSGSHRQADVKHCSHTVKLINDQSIIGLTHRKNHSNQNPAVSCDFFPPARREGSWGWMWCEPGPQSHAVYGVCFTAYSGYHTFYLDFIGTPVNR